MLKVVNISSGDLVGSRFNGFDWQSGLRQHGIESKMLVSWNRNSSEGWVNSISPIFEDPKLRKFARATYLLNQKRGSEKKKFIWSRDLLNHSFYKEADLVHLQIIQDGTLDLETITRIMKEKPTVWTWHDPWPLTGHCIYPMDCIRFELGCGKCPDLVRGFSVGKDKTKSNRSYKKQIIEKSDFTLHLSTKWFEKLVVDTLGDSISQKIHNLPFGINTTFFEPGDKLLARKNLFLPTEQFTIGIRAVKEPQKNFHLFRKALKLLDLSGVKISVVTIQEKGMLQNLPNNIFLRELGWTNSNDELLNFYQSLDLFVMPSLFETFGFMALEAMSVGVPVVAPVGTSVAEITNLHETGFEIDGKSAFTLATVIEYAHHNPSILMEKSTRSRKAAESSNLENFLSSLGELYRDTTRKFQNASN